MTHWWAFFFAAVQSHLFVLHLVLYSHCSKGASLMARPEIYSLWLSVSWSLSSPWSSVASPSSLSYTSSLYFDDETFSAATPSFVDFYLFCYRSLLVYDQRINNTFHLNFNCNFTSLAWYKVFYVSWFFIFCVFYFDFRSILDYLLENWLRQKNFQLFNELMIID